MIRDLSRSHEEDQKNDGCADLAFRRPGRERGKRRDRNAFRSDGDLVDRSIRLASRSWGSWRIPFSSGHSGNCTTVFFSPRLLFVISVSFILSLLHPGLQFLNICSVV